MRMLRIWAYIFAVLACMAVGLEVQRILAWTPAPAEPSASASTTIRDPQSGSETPPVTAASGLDWGGWIRTLPIDIPAAWQPLSSGALLAEVSPTWRSRVEQIGREQVDEGVWQAIARPVLDTPPAICLAVLSALAFLLARFRAGQQVPSPGGLRTLVRVGALGVAALGFVILGADMYRSGDGWETRTIVEVWTQVHPASIDALGDSEWISGLLLWPAWLGLALIGGILAYLTRPRPDLAVYAYPSAPGGAPVRFIDVSRTLAYLDSMRSWPPGRRKRSSSEPPDYDRVDPRHLD